ncbi:MAG: SMC-Scp complex subunit ScpB [Bacteroidota bacterium]
MTNHDLPQMLEAIIFVAEHPVKLEFLQGILAEEAEAKEKEAPTQAEVESALELLLNKYQGERYPFEIRQVAEGYQFYTKERYYPYVKRATLTKNQKRLSRAALETLSIIAYRQPITKAEMEFIRGVNCDYAVQKLLDKQLVSILGRADAPGRPLLYGTSPFFMEYFGIGSMGDMPKLKEFEELAEDHLAEFRRIQQEKEGPIVPEEVAETEHHGREETTQENE